MGDTYSSLDGGGGVPTLRSGWGRGTYSSLDGEVPTFPGLDGGVPTFPGGGGYLGRYPPPPPPEQHSVDWLRRGRYASCVLAQEDFLVIVSLN